MEFYRNEPASVRLEVPAGIIPVEQPGRDPLVVKAVDERGLVLFEFQTVSYANGIYEATLPWHLFNHDQEFLVLWDFAYDQGGVRYSYQDRTAVSVVTPLLPLEEIARIAEYDMATDEGREDARDLERRVRYAIQAYTGQNFGKFRGNMKVRGSEGKALRLPAPLIQFDGLAYDGILRPNFGVEVINGGWALSGGEIYIDNIKQAPPEWMLDRFDYTGKIYAPALYGYNRFRESIEYTVAGVWGYHDVPANVRQAARLLAADYSCDESLWRDRYIDSVRAADWRFEFNAQAFEGTGNAAVDAILSDYRRSVMAVI